MMLALSSEQYQSALQKQLENWPKHLEGAKRGNPFATLCNHCYGRHAPPRDEICLRAPPSEEKE